MCLQIQYLFTSFPWKNLVIPGLTVIEIQLLGQALNVIIQDSRNHSVCCVSFLPVLRACYTERCPIFETWNAHLLWHTKLSLSSWSRWLLLFIKTCFMMLPLQMLTIQKCSFIYFWHKIIQIFFIFHINTIFFTFKIFRSGIKRGK